MKFSNLYKSSCFSALALMAIALSGCEKDGNPNDLAEIDKSIYEGTIDGYKSADEVFSSNLVAYFPFDTDYKEKISGVAPSSTLNNALVDGVKGKALNLNAGYLYYTTQLAALKTDAFKSFTITQWVQIQNNGSKRTMLLTLARPGNLQGSLNLNLNTNSRAVTITDYIGIQPVFATVGGGTQDNLNATLSPKIGPTTWAHIALAYNGLTGRFNIVANGINIGSYSDRGVGNNLFKSYEPGELIIGANYNLIPGKTINTDASYAAMTGKVDEIRIYNTNLPDAIINALYKLEQAKK